MRALLCGVRGSTPAPGVQFVAIGGHTSCVAIPAANGRWLVLDAGTGLAGLARELQGAALRATILLTHLHWDHTHGLPFLPNADRADAEVDVLVPAQPDGAPPLATMARAMSPPHFPIGPDELLGSWHFRSIEPGRTAVEGFEVIAAEIHHAGGRTFGYRVTDDRGSLAYLPDHSPRTAPPDRRAAAEALVRGVDVLLHGGGYLEAERAVADGYGHATVGDAIDLATTGGAGRLVLIHHAPRRTDAEIAAIESELAGTAYPIAIGREGDWVESADEFRNDRGSGVP